MPAVKNASYVLVAVLFVSAFAIESADARRGGGGAFAAVVAQGLAADFVAAVGGSARADLAELLV
ncbi:hypothetical protein JQ543_28085 [Bradyrhizobium diazoefficiens]|nr:hypothetical protein [Bradyrhizobium diazoefficiens]MBR0851632.1 hypothetical protein [Bradyrhizobium diazoefficiens]